MANSEGEFDYCEICRQSHRKGKKHLYSKTHREKIKYILQRFGKKVQSAKKDIAAPCILAGSHELQGSYWCYMCQTEVTKHVGDGQITIRHAGFIEHLKSANHLVKTDKFWRDNRLDRELKVQYALTQDAYTTFQLALEKALDRFDEEQRKDIDMRAAEIRRVEVGRKRLLEGLSTQDTNEFPDLSASSSRSCSAVETSCNHDTYGDSNDVPGCSSWNDCSQASTKTASTTNQGTIPSYRPQGSQSHSHHMSRKATTSVLNSGGLTSIAIQVLRPGEGNIHTGATPPWMLEDKDEEASKIMGPSMEDFSKHVDRQKKRKLNPNRVGANFDHASATREEWLPSFGRVWNQGRRWQSRHQYRKETSQANSKRKQSDEHKLPETVSKPP